MRTTDIQTSAVEVCILAHLQEEEQSLVMLLMAVREVRQALISQDGERLTRALESEANSLQIGDSMREKRAVFRRVLAEQLNVVPEEILLSRLDGCVSEQSRAELARCRQRLREMAEEITRLNRQNAAMIQQTLDLTARIVGQLTGGGPHFTGYNAHGKSEAANVGPVLQWGG